MKKRAIVALSVLSCLYPLWAAAAVLPVKEKSPGDKRNGEEEQIRERERWFAERRGLDFTYRPGELREQAVQEQRRIVRSQGPERVVGFSWQSLGPSPMNMTGWQMGRVAGRVSALAIHPTNEQTIYLGTASGGLWKSVDGGSFWTPLFDAIGTGTIGSLALDPNNANNVWVGTGEKGWGCSEYFGMGLFRSTDAGASFQASNGSGGTALGLSNVTAVAVQPGNSSLVLAGGPGFCSGGALTGDGIRRSTDGGITWSFVLTGQPNDLLFDPLVPSTVYASIGGNTTSNGGVFRSTDGGASWSQLAGGLPFSSFSRVRLAMAPTNRLVLYALFQTGNKSGLLYRSLDGGSNWSLRNTGACTDQCWYNLTLDVSPTTSDTLLVGSILFNRSTNGGTTLSPLISGWGASQRVHQDIQVVRYSRTNVNRFWVGSDGGLWRTDDGGSTYANLNGNLTVTQFYDVAVHPTNSSRIWGGAQDNSSEIRTTSSIWDVVTVTGDGFTNAVDAGNPNYVFIESYPDPNNGNRPQIYRSSNGGGTSSFSGLSNSGLGTGFPWKTEYVVIPAGSASYLVTGAANLYRTSARGAISWSQISSGLSFGILSALGSTPTSGGTLYAGFTDGRIFRTSNVVTSPVTWTEVTGNFGFGTVSDLAVDPTSRLRVFATRSSFGGNKLYRSTSGGGTWAAVGNGLPDVPANSVAIDPVNRQRLFVATDIGVYVSEDNGDNFLPQMAGLPLGVVAMDLEVDDSPHVLTLGTYGRGAWQLQLPAETPACIPDGGVDDSLGSTSCCSGLAVNGSSFCVNPSDLTTCQQICATQPVGGCIPSGGVDDVLSQTSCCSGAAVAGSTWCLNPANWANGWQGCVQTCQ